LYPFYYAIINSFNSGQALLRGFDTFLPSEPTMDSWKTVISDKAFTKAFLITVSRTLLVTIGSTIITSMFAYAYSRSYLRGKKFYTALGFTSMYFSGGIISFFLLISALKLYDNYWVYIIPSLFGGFYNVIIYNTNFKALPTSLFESAKLDGANEWRIYTNIVMPLSKPVIAALCVFTAVGVWNDYTTTLYYTQSQDLQTLQHYILKLVRSYNASEQLASSAMANNAAVANTLQSARLGTGKVTSKTIELAAMVLSSIPMIIAYPFAQKFFVQGVLVGSIKE
ncbi:MAG: carbohydrate ABC transporter permease, partial [Clostridiales bacterium]|nr:carbohydrate ABC transporter permease [Clostridiales bacterium]